MNETFSLLCGQRLREARAALGMSQDVVATHAGVTREQWGRYERGISAPGAEVLAALALAGVDVMYVLTGGRDSDVSAVTLAADERVLLDRYREAEPAVQRAALGALLGASVDAASGPLVRNQFNGPVGQQLTGGAHSGHTVVMPGGMTVTTHPPKGRKKKP